MDKLKHTILSKFRHSRRNLSDNAKVSYAQCGEDLILECLCRTLGIERVRYLDIGAHHPSYLSNTYHFYNSGGKGVCVEPDPSLFAEFPKKRPEDTHLNCGVGIEPGEADFFVMSTSTLNTFSREEAERYQSYGNQKILKVLKMKLMTVNEIIGKHFDRCPNLVSLDVEGLDYAILKSFDFEKLRPEVFCLETLSYTEDKSERKLTEIIDLMHEKGYLTYADTYINTIFVDADVWKKRP